MMEVRGFDGGSECRIVYAFGLEDWLPDPTCFALVQEGAEGERRASDSSDSPRISSSDSDALSKSKAVSLPEAEEDPYKVTPANVTRETELTEKVGKTV